MPTVKGSAEFKRFMSQAPGKIEKIVQGAARAGANVIADEAKSRCRSDEVRQQIKVRTKREVGTVDARVFVERKGPSNLGLWLEYGTNPHFISVAAEQRQGLSVRKVNERGEHHSLQIGGKFVGPTVFHPGAQPHPFMRPALDIKEGEAIAAAQAYIDARISRTALNAQDEGDEE